MAPICLDNSFLSEYLAENDDALHFFNRFPYDTRVLLPAIVWAEAMTSAYRTGDGRTEELTKEELSTFTFIPLGREEASEASKIKATLLDHGNDINDADYLIAGTARAHGAKVVHKDGDFERIPDLETCRFASG